MSNTSKSVGKRTEPPPKQLRAGNLEAIEKTLTPDLLTLYTRFVCVETKIPNPVSLLLDTGAMLNLIRTKVVNNNHEINTKDIIYLTGLANQTISTLGKTIIEIFDHPSEFNVVPNNFPITQDRLLGDQFFKETRAKIDYDAGCLDIKT